MSDVKEVKPISYYDCSAALLKMWIDNVITDGRLRKLTPRECLRLMGFLDSFKIEVSDTAMYQQAGNSIVVDVLIAIMESILNVYPELDSKQQEVNQNE